MQLLASWKDSFSNVSEIFFNTFKSLKGMYNIWLKCWGWLVLIFIVGSLYDYFNCSPLFFLFTGAKQTVLNAVQLHVFVLANFLCDLLVTLIIISIFLSSKVTDKVKNYRYFFGYRKHVIYILLWFFLLPLISYGATQLAYFVFGAPRDFKDFHVSLILFSIFIFWLTTFFITSLMYSNGSFKNAVYSLFNSLKMIIYNAPFLMLLTLGIFIIYGLFTGLLSGFLLVSYETYMKYSDTLNAIASVESFILNMMLVVPVMACFTNNYYVKRLHDQFNLYFEVK